VTTIHSPAPDRTSGFSELGLPPEFVALLRRRDIVEPLPIQALAIDDQLAGRDVSCCAPTGSGKTLAFGLPMTARLERGRPRRPTGLVLAPTRELASQIAAALRPFAELRGLRVLAVFGGVGYGPQLTALGRGVDLLVACPGRLEDLLARRALSLEDVSTVVLDEADRMADMGFLPAVRRLLDATRSDRQTLLFSATLDGDVDVIVQRYQRDPVRHEVAVEDRSHLVSHRFHYVAHADRVASCARLIGDSRSTIVFVRTRHGADRLVRQLGRAGVRAAAIHGDRSQGQRDRALHDFRSGAVRALVATDVAARGIHVDDVECVVHFDLPSDAKDYVHRSGRTARAGAGGAIVAFVTEEHHQAARQLLAQLDVVPVLDGAVPQGANERHRVPTAARNARPTSRGRSRRRGATGPARR
jgi:superfamily II DNA/RNA helicase